MKINPIPQGAVPSVNPNEGMSAGVERLARAKAIASGQDPALAETTGDAQVDRTQASIKRIKMRTQRSPNRHELVQLAPETAAAPLIEESEEAPGVPKSDTLETIEPATAVSEENKPLSPQFAALAKQKRALQLREQEILVKEKALETQSNGTKSLEDYRARIKANALSVLQEEGVTYDQLTEQILASNQNDVELSALKAEIKSLREGFETQNKTQTERETQAEQQALAQIRRDADKLIAEGDDFEMIREAGYAPKVVELIHKVWKRDGTLLDIDQAANLIETELLNESLKFAKIKKVQSRLNPEPAPKAPPVQQDRPGTKVMRTLTNRDGQSSLSMSKRERAIAAMEGRLHK